MGISFTSAESGPCRGKQESLTDNSLLALLGLDKNSLKHLNLQTGSCLVVWLPELIFSATGTVFTQASMDGNVSPLVVQPLWSRMAYLSSYWMDYHEILCRNSWSPENES